MSQKPKKPVEVVVFDNPEKKKSDSKTSKQPLGQGKRLRPLDKESDGPSPSFTYDPKKAKYDVRKLAIHSMKKTEKDEAMVDLLVELGAKRPKNKCLHPRDYMQQLKKKREEEKEEALRNGMGKLKNPNKKRRRNKDDILGFVDGQKGKYKGGVQYMSSLSK